MWPTVMLKGKYYHSKVPKQQDSANYRDSESIVEAPQNLRTSISIGSLSVMTFFLPLCTYCCFSLSFFPPLLFLTPSVSLSFCLNTPLIEKWDPCKRCTEAGPSHCYTNNIEKR